ncbi:MAG: alpha/beta hydrolase [Gemmatimonadales bacterium]
MIREHRIAVQRSARYYTIGEPGNRLREVWFACHGYGQLARSFARYLTALDDGERMVVVPEGLSRYYVEHESMRVGASWMTREDRLTEIKDYVTYLDRLHEHIFTSVRRDAVKCRVLGFSQGTATVTRWTAFGRVRVDQLILWGGLVPPDLDLEGEGRQLRETNLVFVLGTADEFVTEQAMKQEEQRLRAAAIPFAVRRFNGGHRMDLRTLRALAEREP